MLQKLHGSAPGNEKSLQGLLPNIASNIEKKKLIRTNLLNTPTKIWQRSL